MDNYQDKTLEKRRKLIEDNFKAEGKVCPLCHKKLNHHSFITTFYSALYPQIYLKENSI
ncbi:hypothetical protein PPL_06782 [Heterostelium album PN500]|uniref:Uncharacterized protein n=1 Tax=Heterostelium pallidum (strain ATCC 26659 / Pp 5 / PN500) TaxID=670386 RepID=D3BFP7_HETP5|nr:hypothetical protein PPL_06782 [Heterostelium album PN500]EFA79961.1 hypothetical protein PPL_06782 [Heterostelium album PN500]|eukprot:XP_020432081.1 hypothetical protein PPL_06782 [Heterostelium album PN500]